MTEEKHCQYCETPFEPKQKRSKFCSRQCGVLACHKKNRQKYTVNSRAWAAANREKARAAASSWAEKNPEKQRAINTEWYDNVGFLDRNERAAQYLEQLRQDPVKWAAHLERRTEYSRRYYARKKLEATRASYLADPINAARIAEANYLRMTPEEKEKWHQKIEAEQEKADRKAYREAKRKELAAMTIDTTKVIEQTGDTWAHLDFAK